MRTLKYLSMLVITLAAVIPATAQQNDSLPQKKTSPVQVRLGVFYNSGLNYYGRTDSLRSSGVFPVAELTLHNNYYVNAAPVFVFNSTAQGTYAGTVLTGGYRFYHENKDAGNFYVVKPLYRDNSSLVQSALKAQVAGTYSVLSKVLNFTLGADVKFSDQADYGLTAGLDHILKFPGKGFVIVADPSAYVYAGTQQFTRTYYKKSSFLFLPGTEQKVSEKVKQFNVLSYEFSVPLVAVAGKWQLLAVPAYVLPQNLVVVDNRPDLSERGKNMFYITVGAKYTL